MSKLDYLAFNRNAIESAQLNITESWKWDYCVAEAIQKDLGLEPLLKPVHGLVVVPHSHCMQFIGISHNTLWNTNLDSTPFFILYCPLHLSKGDVERCYRHLESVDALRGEAEGPGLGQAGEGRALRAPNSSPPGLYREAVWKLDLGSSRQYMAGRQEKTGPNWNKRGSDWIWETCYPWGHPGTGREPREVVQSPTQSVELSTCRDQAPSNLVWSHTWPCCEQGGQTKDFPRSLPTYGSVNLWSLLIYLSPLGDMIVLLKTVG